MFGSQQKRKLRLPNQTFPLSREHTFGGTTKYQQEISRGEMVFVEHKMKKVQRSLIGVASLIVQDVGFISAYLYHVNLSRFSTNIRISESNQCHSGAPIESLEFTCGSCRTGTRPASCPPSGRRRCRSSFAGWRSFQPVRAVPCAARPGTLRSGSQPGGSRSCLPRRS